MVNATARLVHYCTLSLSDIWVTRQIIITNSQWSIQRLSRWVTNYCQASPKKNKIPWNSCCLIDSSNWLKSLIIFWWVTLFVPLAWIRLASMNLCTIWLNEIRTNSKFQWKYWFQSNLRIGNGSVGFVQNCDPSAVFSPCSISAPLSFHQTPRLSSSMQGRLGICYLKNVKYNNCKN